MRPECKTVHAIELLYINLLTKPFPEHIGKVKGGDAGGGGGVLSLRSLHTGRQSITEKLEDFFSTEGNL